MYAGRGKSQNQDEPVSPTRRAKAGGGFIVGPFPFSKGAARRMGMLRQARSRGMGVTRKPSSRRLPKSTIIGHMRNPK